MFRKLNQQPYLVQAIWFVLAIEFCVALYEGNWSIAFIALATFVLSVLPVFFVGRFGIKLPTSFVVGIVAFIFATIFLGEAFDFYNRYWWWDVVLHGGSAMGFGLIGFLVMFMLFRGDRYAAPAGAVSFFAFCFAVMIGVVWEVFEFFMDRNFGFNMQKSGLDDTMWDLIVNMIGAAVGAASGYFYLRGQGKGWLSGVIGEFVDKNRQLYRRRRNRRR